MLPLRNLNNARIPQIEEPLKIVACVQGYDIQKYCSECSGRSQMAVFSVDGHCCGSCAWFWKARLLDTFSLNFFASKLMRGYFYFFFNLDWKCNHYIESREKITGQALSVDFCWISSVIHP